MTSVNLRFRTPSEDGKVGALYFQLIQRRVVRQVKLDCYIYRSDWDKEHERLIPLSKLPPADKQRLRYIREKVLWEEGRIKAIVREFEGRKVPYSLDEVVCWYRERRDLLTSVFTFMGEQIDRLRRMGKIRTCRNYQAALSSFSKFRQGLDLHFERLDAELVEHYETFLRSNHLSRNTTSFYMRIWRTVFRRAKDEGLLADCDLFRGVYTGVDKTSKRAITQTDMRSIKSLDLSHQEVLDLARDLFLFSFYMRGMSFIDMAYLRKEDLCNGYVTYCRRKTGQQLVVRWEQQMQEIVDKYDTSGSPYLLPIIVREDGTEYRQYQNKMWLINRKLKQVAARAGFQTPLTMYVARHSWASVAKSQNIPVGIISEAMGHDSESTTQIYLSSIQTETIDLVNQNIITGLL